MDSGVVVEKSKLNNSVEIFSKKSLKTTELIHKKQERIAAYCRVSKNLDIQKSSLDMQIDSYTKIICEKKEWRIAKIYYDNGISGTQVRKRLGFQQMIDDCKSGKIDIIITKSISRFARNTLDLLEYVRLLKELGVGVYFEKERIDTRDSTSEMLLTVYAAFAQEESLSISENIKQGFMQRFLMGQPKYSKLYGYSVDSFDRNKWKIVTDEASVIRTIFDKYIHGHSIDSILVWLNDNNIQSTYGKNWYKTTITNLLRNEKYVGDVVMQKTVVIDTLNHVSVSNRNQIVPQYFKKNHHDQIIDRETFNVVQRMLVLKKCTNGSQQYPYYDYLKCPFCGKQMVQFMTNMSKNPTAWICSDMQNCKEYFLLTKYIDRAVISGIDTLCSCNGELKEMFEKAKEHFSSGKVELYYLNKLITSISISKDYSSIIIQFANGTNLINKIDYDRPSEQSCSYIEYKDDGILINGRHFSALEGRRIINCIKRVQQFNKTLKVFSVDDTKDVIRIKNNANKGKMSWGRIKK